MSSVGHSRQAFRRRVNFAIARGNADAAIIQTLAVSKPSRRRKTTPPQWLKTFHVRRGSSERSLRHEASLSLHAQATRPFYGLAESNEATKRAFSETVAIRRAGGAHL